MISLKRNKKTKELVEAKGLRIKQSSIYKPNQTNDFKISRSKFNDFLRCQKCFYLDRVKGLVSPSMPGWTLNETTDLLLKKEFDHCRKIQKPHRILLDNNLDHVIPFNHPDLEKWRDSLHGGLGVRFKKTNIILAGGIDDVWQNSKTKEIIVVDYKSQATDYPVNPKSYFDSPYHADYQLQLDFYAYLFKEMNFEVAPIGYLVVCNADGSAKLFNKNIKFSETLVPYELKIDEIPKKIERMIQTLNKNTIPLPNKSCENCAYAYQRNILK